jgi:FkbM family methyltransferase
MSISSALHTIAVERRLPYRVDRAWQRAARTLGSPEHTVSTNGLTMRVRRLTCDELFVVNIIERREYFRHGFTIEPTDTVVDIGGNIGAFAVLAGSLATGGRVVTVEPDSRNVRLLEQNLALNGLRNVTVMHAAISGTDAPVTLHLAAEGGGFNTTVSGTHNHQLARAWTHAVTVPGITLADVFHRHAIDRCDFLKIDCEGAEFDAIAACPLDVLQRVRRAAMEYHAQTGDQRISAFLSKLRDSGLRIVEQECFQTGRGGHLFLER